MTINKEQAAIILDLLWDKEEFGLTKDEIDLASQIFTTFPDLIENYGGLI
jgi:hypothetical protein